MTISSADTSIPSNVGTIPFFRPSVGDAEINAVVECLRSGWLTTGPQARAFEEEFAACLGPVEAVAVNSATAALHLGLEAMGVGEGDEVILPTLTFTATAEVVRYMGARPTFVDMDPTTLCLDLDAVEAAITPRTRVIMPVHFAGRPCDLKRLRAIADRNGLRILSDAAHAFPATQGGRPVGDDLADATAFSFYANKTMTTGEGGMLTTRDADLAGRARVMRLHGIDRDVFNRFTDPRADWLYDVVAPGFKYNLTDPAAALGRVQLARREDFLARRTELAARYDDALTGLPLLLPPHAADEDVHSWHLYIIRVTDAAPITRNELAAGMREAGIGISVHYRPLHQLSVWSDHGGAFPQADHYFERCLSLPLFMAMTRAEQARVIEVVAGLLS